MYIYIFKKCNLIVAFEFSLFSVNLMILVFTGRSGYINDLHYWATHRVCWHWPDLHRSQIFERQGSCSRFDEVIPDLVHQSVFLTCYSPAFKFAKRARKCLSFLLKKNLCCQYLGKGYHFAMTRSPEIKDGNFTLILIE